jgi:hypothetical protein
MLCALVVMVVTQGVIAPTSGATPTCENSWIIKLMPAWLKVQK